MSIGRLTCTVSTIHLTMSSVGFAAIRKLTCNLGFVAFPLRDGVVGCRRSIIPGEIVGVIEAGDDIG